MQYTSCLGRLIVSELYLVTERRIVFNKDFHNKTVTITICIRTLNKVGFRDDHNNDYDDSDDANRNKCFAEH